MFKVLLHSCLTGNWLLTSFFFQSQFIIKVSLLFLFWHFNVDLSLHLIFSTCLFIPKCWPCKTDLGTQRDLCTHVSGYMACITDWMLTRVVGPKWRTTSLGSIWIVANNSSPSTGISMIHWLSVLIGSFNCTEPPLSEAVCQTPVGGGGHECLCRSRNIWAAVNKYTEADPCTGTFQKNKRHFFPLSSHWTFNFQEGKSDNKLCNLVWVLFHLCKTTGTSSD